MKRILTFIIVLLIATFTFAMNSDTDVYGGNNRLRRFYVPQLFQVMSSSEAERYRGVDDVNVHNYVNLNRAYVILRNKALEYSKNGGFGEPIRRDIPYLGILDSTDINPSRYRDNGLTICLVNFEKYRRMNQAWRYHDLFVYGANQIKGNQIDKSAPLIGINSPEARTLRYIALLYKAKHASYLRIQNIIPRTFVIWFDRTYNRNKDKLKGVPVRDITDLYLRTMDLSWDLIPSRYVAAAINLRDLYITDDPNHQLGVTVGKTPAEVAHVPSHGNIVFVQRPDITEEDYRAVTRMVQNNEMKPLWNRWDTDDWEHMNQARTVLVVESSAVEGSELFTWLRVLIDLKLITPKHMLALLIMSLGLQEVHNNAAFLGKRANADYVIDAQPTHIPIYKNLFPNAKFVTFHREFNRLIRASGGTAWLYYASVIASRYIWRGGATGITRCPVTFRSSDEQRIREIIRMRTGREATLGDIQMSSTTTIASIINSVPNSMNQPNGGRAFATGSTSAIPYTDR